MRPTRSVPMIALILSFAAPALAQEPTPGQVGVGVALGQPTGLSLKLRVAEHESVELVGGVGFAGETGASLAYLYESKDLLGSDLFLNAFFGVGGIYLHIPGEDDPQEYEETEHDHIGVAIPIGVELRLPAVPRLGLHAEIIPGYGIVDRPGFVAGAFVGARWWF